MTGIVKWYGDHQDEMIPAAGPGHWNDPDMVRHFMQLFLRKDNFYYWIIVIIFLQLMISYIFLAYCR